MDEPLSDQELTELEELTRVAAPAPWVAFVQNGLGGDSFIRLDGLDDQFPPDMYIHRDDKIAPDPDIEFIAAARNYMPRLLAELHRRRSQPL
jgi:hypothetical protein